MLAKVLFLAANLPVGRSWVLFFRSGGVSVTVEEEGLL